MADTAKRLLGPTQLGTGASTVYTVPAATTTTILHLVAVNTSGNPATLTVSIGADAANKRVLHKVPVPTDRPYEFKGFLVLSAAEIVQAYSDTATAVTLSVSGVETT